MKRTTWLLLGLVVVGAFLRWINLSESMPFFYDQARDALKAVGILHHNFVLAGPATDTPGLFMGPLWYYLLAPLYFIFRGNPVWVTVAVSLFDLAAIPLFYVVGRIFFNRRVALLAAAIWAMNAHAVAYARTLTNPSSTVFWTLLLIYFLNRRSVVLVSLIVAVLFQLSPAATVMIFPFVVYEFWVQTRGRVNVWWIFLAVGIFLASLIPQTAFEFRHQFIGLSSIVPLVLGGKGGAGNIVNTWLSHLLVWLQTVQNYSFPEGYIVAAVTFFLGLWLINKEKIAQKKMFLAWAILPVLMFVFIYIRSESHPHYLLAWAPAMVLLAAYLFSYLKQRSLVAFIFVLAVFLQFNFLGIYGEVILKNHIGQPADPNPIGFNDEVRVVDFVYSNHLKGPFGYYAYNLTPYWADETWQYLFSWYGQSKYGYVPERNGGNLVYVIYEPDPFYGDFVQGPWLRKLEAFHYKGQGDYQKGPFKIRKMTRCKGVCGVWD